LSNSRPDTIESSAFATVSLPTAGEPWRKTSFMLESIARKYQVASPKLALMRHADWTKLRFLVKNHSGTLILAGRKNMDPKQLLVPGASVLASSLGGRAVADAAQDTYVRVAEIEVDPVQLEVYKAAAKEVIENSVRLEPGVLALYSVSDKDNPAHVTVFEMYADRDAYEAHLKTPHFKKYKVTTQDMVRSLKLRDTVPIALGAKAK
jgi:quinol monooxygenase YgiN